MKQPELLRAAVVGAGLMGRWHAHAIVRAGGSVVVVVDRDSRRAAALAARYSGARVVDDLAGTTKADALDVAHLCTPSGTHAALATQALRRGLHVLVEKPLAETAAQTEALLALADANDRRLCPVYQFLYQPGVLQARQEIVAIMPLLHLDATLCSAGAEGRLAQERDRVASEILPHPLSLAARLTEAPISEASWRLDHAAPGELRLSALLGKTTVSIVISMAGRPTTNALRLIGAHGTIDVNLYHGYSMVDRGRPSPARKVAQPFLLSGRTVRAATGNLLARAVQREPAYPGLRALITRFYLAIRGEAETPVISREILEVAMARDKVNQLMEQASGGASRLLAPVAAADRYSGVGMASQDRYSEAAHA